MLLDLVRQPLPILDDLLQQACAQHVAQRGLRALQQRLALAAARVRAAARVLKSGEGRVRTTFAMRKEALNGSVTRQ